jgi:Fe2+ transport system protein FeoA
MEVLRASEYEAPIECRIKNRRVTIPLGLARAIFVEEAS